MANEKNIECYFTKSELDIIINSLDFRSRILEKDVKKTKNLNNPNYRKKTKELKQIEILSEQIRKNVPGLSHYILFELDR